MSRIAVYRPSKTSQPILGSSIFPYLLSRATPNVPYVASSRKVLGDISNAPRSPPAVTCPKISITGPDDFTYDLPTGLDTLIDGTASYDCIAEEPCALDAAAGFDSLLDESAPFDDSIDELDSFDDDDGDCSFDSLVAECDEFVGDGDFVGYSGAPAPLPFVATIPASQAPPPALVFGKLNPSRSSNVVVDCQIISAPKAELSAKPKPSSCPVVRSFEEFKLRLSRFVKQHGLEHVYDDDHFVHQPEAELIAAAKAAPPGPGLMPGSTHTTAVPRPAAAAPKSTVVTPRTAAEAVEPKNAIVEAAEAQSIPVVKVAVKAEVQYCPACGTGLEEVTVGAQQARVPGSGTSRLPKRTSPPKPISAVSQPTSSLPFYQRSISRPPTANLSRPSSLRSPSKRSFRFAPRPLVK